MRIVRPGSPDRVAQRPKRVQIMIEIDILKHEYVGRCRRYDRRDGHNLRIAAPQNIAQQQAGAVPCKFDIVGGDPQVFRPRVRNADQKSRRDKG